MPMSASRNFAICFGRKASGCGPREATTSSHGPASGNGSNGSDDDVYADRAPTSIFHSHRFDYDRIVDLVPSGASVLDLGCGRGALLKRLRKAGAGRLVGVELDGKSVLHCVGRGLDVIQSDLNNGLGPFTEGQFDYVILSHTLQAVRDVERVISDMLRVGRHSIVSDGDLGHARDFRYPPTPRRCACGHARRR